MKVNKRAFKDWIPLYSYRLVVLFDFPPFLCSSLLIPTSLFPLFLSSFQNIFVSSPSSPNIQVPALIWRNCVILGRSFALAVLLTFVRLPKDIRGYDLSRELKEKLCYVALDYFKEEKIPRSQIEKTYDLCSGR